METNEIQEIKSMRTICIIGLFVPFINFIATPILYHKINKNKTSTVLVCIGMFIPFLGLCLMIVTLIQASDKIKLLYEKIGTPVEYTEQELAKYENEVSIDEEALNRYLSYKKK